MDLSTPGFLRYSFIYFESDAFESALVLSEHARRNDLFEFVEISEKPVGPHPVGMVEAHFTEGSYPSVLEWLEANRGSFSVLIHPDTGDDFKDHTQGIRWLGREWSLDFDFFRRIQMRPELRVHE